MRGVEPSNVGFLRTDFELIVGILLNAFDLSCKCYIALSAVVLLYAKPARASNNNCGGYGDTPGQRFHYNSVLPG